MDDSPDSDEATVRISNDNDSVVIKGKHHGMEDSAALAKVKDKAGSVSNTGQSMFLPSLSVGFIPSASASDYSDFEEDDIQNVRRNRRGQRARKA